MEKKIRHSLVVARSPEEGGQQPGGGLWRNGRKLEAIPVVVFGCRRSIRCAVLSLVGFTELPHGFLHCRLEVKNKLL
ncbi:hypothetical protein L2E82_02014 [Cichorium intybus]|uniref:Uncharacterized protein n=1 Tax=Cichorium intybus TaxID=13427 RepID=A0ACB9H196_CICIN|nr:hypothetical protein L2E82_02014 [Cichorium intybus]